MTDRPVTRGELDEQLVYLRADQGVVIGRIYEDVRRELSLELKSFRNEMRVLVVGAFVVLGFDLPNEITVAAIVAVFAKAAYTAASARLFGG